MCGKFFYWVRGIKVTEKLLRKKRRRSDKEDIISSNDYSNNYSNDYSERSRSKSKSRKRNERRNERRSLSPCLLRSPPQHEGRVVLHSSPVPSPRKDVVSNQIILPPDFPPVIQSYFREEKEEDYRKSKGEQACKEAIERIYGVPFYRVRPNWLRNPKTGRALEIDLYNEQLKIGVEFNGRQHYEYTPHFHKGYQAFLDQVERDNTKLDICDREGVYLITVPYYCPVEYIERYIRYYLPEAVAAREYAISRQNRDLDQFLLPKQIK